jgi:arylsulfatase A-like enzyme
MPLPRLRDPKIFEAMPGFLQESMNRDRYFWRWDTPEKYDANLRARFRMLAGMDGIIGRVLAKLDEEGLADNTVIIYSADNGYYRAERGFAGKWSHFEESLRVPLIIYDPRSSEEQRGRLVDSMVLNIDITPTILDIAGVKIPEKYQGCSLSAILSGRIPDDWRREFFCEHLMEHEDIPKWEGFRGERYVYARYFEQEPPFEFLHDLVRDPDQMQNFATGPEAAAVLEEARKRCAGYVKKYSRHGSVQTGSD